MPNTDTAVARPMHLDAEDPRKFAIRSNTGVKAFTKMVEIDGQSVERKFIHGTASSNVKDRQGDTLDQQCQASMLSQAKGLTAWLNHSYEIPGSILGTITDASLHTRTDSHGEVLDMDIDVMIDDENPNALKCWKHIQNGTKLAFSIGGIFKDFDIVEPEDENDFWAWLSPDLIVHDLELLEISLVGIPANPRAYTKSSSAFNATKGLRASVEAIAKYVGPNRMKDPATRALVSKSLMGDRKAQQELDAIPAATPEELAEASAAPPPSHVDIAATLEADDAVEAALTTETAESTEPPTETAEPVDVVDKTATDAAIVDETTTVGDTVEPSTTATVTTSTTDETATLAGAFTAPEVPVAFVDDTATAPATETVDKTAVVTTAKDAGTPGDAGDVGTDVSNGAAASTPVDGQGNATAPLVMDDGAHSAIVGAMRQVKTAHKALKALLPDDYDVPLDADVEIGYPSEDGVGTDTLAAVVSAFKAGTATANDVLKAFGLAELSDTVEQLSATRDSVSAEVADTQKRVDALRAEATELESKVEKLRATPLGRRGYGAQPGASRSERTGGVPTENWTKSPTQLAKEAAEAYAASTHGVGTDARDRLT